MAIHPPRGAVVHAAIVVVTLLLFFGCAGTAEPAADGNVVPLSPREPWDDSPRGTSAGGNGEAADVDSPQDGSEERENGNRRSAASSSAVDSPPAASDEPDAAADGTDTGSDGGAGTGPDGSSGADRAGTADVEQAGTTRAEDAGAVGTARADSPSTSSRSPAAQGTTGNDSEEAPEASGDNDTSPAEPSPDAADPRPLDTPDAPVTAAAPDGNQAPGTPDSGNEPRPEADGDDGAADNATADSTAGETAPVDSENGATRRTESQLPDGIPMPVGWVNDFGNVIAAEVEDDITLQIEAVRVATGAEIAVLVVESYAPFDSIEAFGPRVASYWGLGTVERREGVLITVALEEREVRIDVGQGLLRVISDQDAGLILDEAVVPHLSRNDFGAAMSAGVATIAERITEAREAE